MNTFTEYFTELGRRLCGGWNRFWFSPADPYTLSLLRLLTGIVALYYVFSFSSDLALWFAPDGLLAIDTLDELIDGEDTVRPSILKLADSVGMLYAVHAVSLLVAAMFMVGLFSRCTNILTLLAVLSYAHRAPMITGLVEPILAMVLFYLCFAPTGSYLSVDRWLKKRRQAEALEQTSSGLSTGANISQRLIQVHLAGFYMMFALTKLEGPTWWMGDAMWWLIARPESRVVDVTFLAGHTYVINIWTHSVVAFELAFAILIWVRWARPLLLLLALPAWILLALATGELAFCAMMLIGNMSFVPALTLRRIMPGQVGA